MTSLNDILAAQREAMGLEAPPERREISQATLELVGEHGGTGYGRKALLEEVERVRTAVEGERNNTLFTAACNLAELVNGGHLDETQVRDSLEAAGVFVGLDGAEITQTLDSAEKRVGDNARGPAAQGETDVFGGLRVDMSTGEVLPDDPSEGAEDPFADVAPALTAPLEVERTSWWPRDIGRLVAGEVADEEPPAYLRRTDGKCLFYRGKVNALIGESESGKSWIGFVGVAQALQAGENVLILDFEDTAAGVIGRLRSLGCSEADLARLVYISPDEALGAAQQRDLVETLATHKPGLILFDGVNAAMTLLGLNLTDNMDVTKFSMAVLRPLKRTGACLVTIDHVTKSKEGRGNYAIGAQAKRADIDGCALLVEVTKPFGKGMTGRLRLTVSKDRPGEVRAISSGGKGAGTVVLSSAPDGAIAATVEAPDLRPKDEKPAWRPTVLMQRVSEYLIEAGTEMSQTAIKKNVTGNEDHLIQAVEFLVEDGYAERRITTQGWKMYMTLSPYLAPPEEPTPTNAIPTPSSA